ncbi:MAG: hypothetical protein COB83_04835 [Gammaproteobacteria bacterium]|nr:MAG: hypothetical protein COB83_04835 [Gammaproteobacteria bacterium]
MKVITWKGILASWTGLIILTLISVAMSSCFYSFNASKGLFIVSVMAIVVLKGQQIVDVFMELKYAPKSWRYILLSYIIILPIVIALIYL